MGVVLRPLRAATPMVRLAIALAALAIVGVGGAVSLLAPARARAVALEARLAALRSETARARTAVDHLARDRRARAEMEQRLETVGDRLPAARDIAPLYRRTYEAASSAGLVVSLFQPREARTGNDYAEIPISLTAEGTYHQIGAFLERLARLSRLVIVSAVKMSRLERPGAPLRAEMTLATYVYRAPGTPVAPSRLARPPMEAARAPGPQAIHTYVPRGRRDPFEIVMPPGAEGPEAVAPRRPAIAAGMLTGIVRGPQGPLALVEMPDGAGHILRPGDGIAEARLLRIDRHAVVFEIPPGAGLGGEQITLALGRAR